VSHEALIRRWQLLQRWVEAEAKSAEVYRRLADRARLWREGNADLFQRIETNATLAWRDRECPSAAWASRYGGDFDLAIQFLDLSENECRRQEKEQELKSNARVSRARRIAAFSLVGLIAALALCGWALSERYRAKRESARAEKASVEVSVANKRLSESNERLSESKVIAETKKQQAETALKRAEKSERDANQNLYVAQVRLAHSLIKDGEIRSALELLDPSLSETSSAASDSTAAATRRSAADRGWEWYYLDELCRSRLGLVRNEGGLVTHVVFHPNGGSYFTDDVEGNVVERSAGTGEMLRTFRNSGRKESGLGFGLRWHNGQLTVASQTALLAKRTEELVPEPGDVVVALSDSTGQMATVTELDAARITALLRGPVGSRLRLDVKPPGQGQVKQYKVTRRAYDSLGQWSAITALTVSPDGTLLGTAGNDKSFRIWGLEGYLFPTLIMGGANLPNSVTSMAISPNNEQISLAVGSRVALGSLRRGALLVFCGETADRHKETVTHVGFVPQRPWLASVANDGTLKLWDVATKKLVRTADVTSKETSTANRDVWHLALSPDGKRIAVVVRPGKLICWSVDSNGELKLLDQFSEKPRMFNHVAFRPSDGLLAATAYDGTIRLFNQNGAEVRRLAHSRAVGDLAFSTEGRFMVSTTARDKFVSLWRLDVPDQVGRVIRQDALRLNLTPDGRRLITASGQTVSLRDSACGRLLGRHKDLAPFFALTSGGKKLVSARGAQIVQVDLDTGNEAVCFKLPSGKARALASDPEGKWVAVTNDDTQKPRVLVFDISQKRVVQELSVEKTEEDLELSWVAFSRDGRTLAHNRSRTEVQLWRWQDGLRCAVIRTDGPQYCGVFQPGSDDLVLGGANGVVSFWAIRDGGELRPKLRQRLIGHRSVVTDMDFTFDGRRMATSGADGTVRVWDPEAGQELLNLRHADDSALTVKFADRGWRVVSGGDSDVKMWDAAILSPQAAREDPWFYLVRGCARSHLSFWEQAVEDFSAAIKRGIDDPYVWQYRGAAQARLKNYPAALADLDKAVTLIPNDPSVWLDRHLARAAAATTALDRALAEQDYARAVDRVGAALQAPENESWSKVSIDREGAEFFGWARLMTDLTRTIDRGNAPWYVHRARGLARVGVATYGEALGDFHKATGLNPDDWQSWRGVARSQMGRDTKNAETDRSHFEAAVAAYDRAIKLNPNSWDLYYLRGLCYRNLKKLDQAIDDFTQASAHNPTAWPPLAERGTARLIRRQFTDAASDFSQARRLGTLDDDSAANAAYADLGQGDSIAYQKLCEDWLLRSKPDSITPASANTLAWVCSIGPNALIDPMRAVRMAEKTVAAKPKSYAYVSTLATALCRAGKCQESIARLDEAVKLRPDGATAYDFFIYALAHHGLGHANLARQSFDKSLAWMAARDRSAAQGARVDYWTEMDRVQCDIMRREVERELGIVGHDTAPGVSR